MKNTNRKLIVKGIYVHIPFCMQKCFYCDFASFAKQSNSIKEEYVKKICEEIKANRDKYEISEGATIYFGGGTPSAISSLLTEKIVNALKENGFWKDPKEVSIEVNPGTADLEKLKAFKEFGFDRLSFGVQSLHDNELKAIGRIHSAKEAIESIEFAKQAGFKRINADLMYGLPFQTVESYKKTIERLLTTDIKHISAYALTLEEGTLLYRMVNKGEIILPEDKDVETMYDLTIDKLAEAGLKRYEISNFSIRAEESRHNLVYWNYEPYLSFGSAACSSLIDKRIINPSIIRDYIKGAKVDSENLDSDTQLAEFMFMGLRKTEGVNLVEAKTRYGIDVYEKFKMELDKAIAEELVLYDKSSSTLKLTRFGMKFGNRVFEIFL